ncbi:GIY-YIG nuclease family protein [Halomonas sp. E19]|uniref:GIY-YIG nuclease family protein n=1 Tax=Halomonas sp. E19 TaxID=3397247 RepID=UPI00403384D1
MSAAPAPWYLYMVETAKGKLYTGITTDVHRRIAQHEAGRGPRRCAAAALALRHFEAVGSQGEALRLEAAIKRLSAAQKRAWLQRRPPSEETACTPS